MTAELNPFCILNSIPPYKRWGSVAELTCHLQNSTRYGIIFSHKAYRPSLIKDVTQEDVTKKDPPLIRGPLTGGYTVLLSQLASIRPSA
jgi:hypothetical protein